MHFFVILKGLSIFEVIHLSDSDKGISRRKYAYKCPGQSHINAQLMQ